MTMSKVWKDVEKKTAQVLTDLLGYPFERVTVSSACPYDVVPVAQTPGRGEAPLIGVECKSRKVIPKWLTDAIEQSGRHRSYEDTRQLTPLVVFATRRQAPADYLAVIRLEDLAALLK